MNERVSGLRRFLAERFSPAGVFGLHLSVGVLLMLAAASTFGMLAEDVVSHERITVVDAALARHLHAFAASRWTPFMLAVTRMHSVAGMLLLMGALFYFLWRRRERSWLAAAVAAVPGGMVLNVLLKLSYQRVRPHFDDPLVTLATYSFPSGHTVSATLLYGFLAAYGVSHMRGWPARMAMLAGAASMALLVGFSRLYLGAHYLSDVLAGMTEGVAWLAVCITAASTWRRFRAARAQLASERKNLN